MSLNNSVAESRLGTAPVIKLFISLAIPAITSQFVNLLYSVIDRIFVGHIQSIGTTALTALGICAPILTLISAFAQLVSCGAAPLASIELGKKNNKKAEYILGNSFTAIVIMAVIMTITLLLFNEPLLYFFGASDVTITYASTYLKIYACGSIFVLITLGLNAFRCLIISAFFITFGIYFTFLAFPDVVIAPFTTNLELIEVTKNGIRVYFAAGILIGIQMASLQTLMALGKAWTSTFLSLLRKVFLLIPFMLILPHIMKNQVLAVIISEPIADVISVAVTIIVFKIQFTRIVNKKE